MENKKDFSKLKEKVENYLIDEIEIDESMVKNPDTKLEDMDIDSIDMAELAIRLQEEFDIVLENDPKLQELVTIGDVIEYFKTKLN